MAVRYFVDTWFFIAFSDPRDTHHRQAQRLSSALKRMHLVTHEGVLAEYLAFFAEEEPWGRVRAAKTVRDALGAMEVVSASGELFRRALDLYEARTDKHYSLVDCISMLVMKDRNITHVLTNDHHFRQEGFTVLSGAP